MFTGGFDGSLYCNSAESGNVVATYHEYDDSLKNRSVDFLLHLPKRKKLLSMSSDSRIRIWKLGSPAEPCMTYLVKQKVKNQQHHERKKVYKHHEHVNTNVTAIQVTKDNNKIIIGDTEGKLRCIDITDVNFDDKIGQFKVDYIVQAHESSVTSIQIVDNDEIPLKELNQR